MQIKNFFYFISESSHSYKAKQTTDDMQTNVAVLQTSFFLMFVHRIYNYFIYKYNSQKRQTEDVSWIYGIFHRLVFWKEHCVSENRRRTILDIGVSYQTQLSKRMCTPPFELTQFQKLCFVQNTRRKANIKSPAIINNKYIVNNTQRE